MSLTTSELREAAIPTKILYRLYKNNQIVKRTWSLTSDEHLENHRSIDDVIKKDMETFFIARYAKTIDRITVLVDNQVIREYNF